MAFDDGRCEVCRRPFLRTDPTRRGRRGPVHVRCEAGVLRGGAHAPHPMPPPTNTVARKDHRRVVDTVTCPTCRARAGLPCRGSKGAWAHRARVPA